MSQSKHSKSNKKTTEEEENNVEFRAPTEVSDSHLNSAESNNDTTTSDASKKPVGKNRSKTPLLVNSPEKIQNGNDNIPVSSGSPNHNHNTRSRSKTPQNIQDMPKDDIEITPNLIEAKMTPEPIDTIPETPASDDLNLSSVDDVGSVSTDKEDEELMPELEFDENEIYLESEGSPNRCKTRRSQLTNLSTPKTPKQNDDEEFVIVSANDLRDIISDRHSPVSLDNVSTTAIAGSDITLNQDITQDILVDETTYTSPDRSVSLRETIRNISPRRTLRSINADNYRKYALVNNRIQNKDTQESIPTYDAVERVTGVKRKSSTSSIQLNEPKKFKESHGFLSYITLPIYNLKNTFISPAKPKMDCQESVDDGNVIKIKVDVQENGERRWCSIM